jgi:hypothetical protein
MPAKWDRCVAKVSGKVGNPYAVCTAAVGAGSKGKPGGSGRAVRRGSTARKGR